MKYCIINLGCRVNRSESDIFYSLLNTIGEPSNVEDADVVIVNSCTVTSIAEKKTRKTVSTVLKKCTSGTVVITGCSANINFDYYSHLNDRLKIVDKFELIEELKKHAECEPSTATLKARVNVKIQDGCDNECSFCIVHVARGKSTSISKEEVINTCKKLDISGVKEIVLTGINLGSYSDPNLCDLLICLTDQTKNVRYRLSSIEPPEVSKNLIELIVSSEGRICRHFHLPVQSGSNKILHDMNRRYSADDFLRLVDEIYRIDDKFSLSTDIIAGFPGESESDFSDTIKLAKYCHFTKLHVFPYSRRAGTPAYDMDGQIDERVKKSRAQVLRDLGRSMRREEFLRRCGSIERVVCEEAGRATTESYFSINLDERDRVDEFLDVRLEPKMYLDI